MRSFPILGIALMTLLLCSSHSALASKWVLINGYFTKSPARTYIDFDSVRPLPNNQVFVWLRVENATPVAGVKKGLLAKIFDCNDPHTATDVETVIYFVGHEQPEIIKRKKSREIKANSVQADAFQLACVARQRKANRPPPAHP